MRSTLTIAHVRKFQPRAEDVIRQCRQLTGLLIGLKIFGRMEWFASVRVNRTLFAFRAVRLHSVRDSSPRVLVHRVWIETKSPAPDVDELGIYLGRVKLVRFEPTPERWVALGPGGIAIVDQWICSHASQSTPPRTIICVQQEFTVRHGLVCEPSEDALTLSSGKV
ncbi:hypothetical protein CSKR_201931 [Clonorchis sinensis]|uniref:Uncharacterized protein n=1 Tax=Clonorchis sinensis TaxID=79923 RepID=A0A8T1MZ91_CLOSI|nr:hypothetical protein CSKR_201931 [Clonorchis sinensis]